MTSLPSLVFVFLAQQVLWSCGFCGEERRSDLRTVLGNEGPDFWPTRGRRGGQQMNVLGEKGPWNHQNAIKASYSQRCQCPGSQDFDSEPTFVFIQRREVTPRPMWMPSRGKKTSEFSV